MKLLHTIYGKIGLILLVITAISIPALVALNNSSKDIRQQAATNTVPGGGCTTYNNTDYITIPINGSPTDKPAAKHPDINMVIRGWEKYDNGQKALVSYGGDTDYIAPKLNTLLENNSSITNTYRVYDWDWTKNSRGSLLTNPYGVTLIGLKTNNGDIVRLPDSGYEIYGENPVNSKGPMAMVLYATNTSLTLKYTREDNVVKGYTIHLDGFNVNSNLLNAYNNANSAGRTYLPSIYSCQILGTAKEGEIKVAVVDTGQYMDPRSDKDWWSTNVNNPPKDGTDQPTQPPSSNPSSHILFGVDPPLSRWANKPDSWELSAVDKIAEACGKVARIGIDWSQIEPEAPQNGNHTYKWDDFDRIINAVSSKGIKIIGLPLTSPSWANGGKPNGESHQWPPTNNYMNDYKAYLKAIVQRYKGKIQYYEIWNEANGCSWHPACSGDKQQKAKEYLPMLKEAYLTIKSIDPSLPVSTTGMDGADTQYLGYLYDLSKGNNTCNSKNCWDAVSVHPYKNQDIDFSGLKKIHDLMNSKGEGNKPIWITEYGWNITDENKKIQYLNNTFNKLASSDFSYVTLAVYLTYADTPQVGVDHYGLATEDLTPKASYYAFKSYVCGQGNITPIPVSPSPTENSNLPVGSCSTVSAGNYKVYPIPDYTIHNGKPIGTDHPDRPVNKPIPDRAVLHPDYILKNIPTLRGWQVNSQTKQLILYPGGITADIALAPKLSTLLERATNITSTYQVYDWKWPEDLNSAGSRGSLLNKYPVTMIGLQTIAGQDKIRLPKTKNQSVELNTDYKAFVLYADDNRITLKYTRDDNVVQGYTIHLENITVNPNLLNLYKKYNSEKHTCHQTVQDYYGKPNMKEYRCQLPAVENCQIIGTAKTNELLVAIRDNGTFMDPRSALDWWDVTSVAPTPGGTNPTIQPTQPPYQMPTLPPSNGDQNEVVSYLYLKLVDEQGNLLNVQSGRIKVSLYDPVQNKQHSSDSIALSGSANEEQLYKKPGTVGTYYYAVRRKELVYYFYGGIDSNNQPNKNDYTVINPGIIYSPGIKGLVLHEGQADEKPANTINMVLRSAGIGGPIATPAPTSTPQLGIVPNCWNIQGPSTIRIGETKTFTAQFGAKTTDGLTGTMDAVKTNNPNPTDQNTWDWKIWPPKAVALGSGTLSFDWTPTAPGVYQVFCRAFNSDNQQSSLECRGAPNTISQPAPAGQSLCLGPGAVTTVNVTTAGIIENPTNGADMCEVAQVWDSNTLLPNKQLTFAAVAKPTFDIDSYLFTFYNLDSQKPIHFEKSVNYVITSKHNTIFLKYDDFNKPDLNYKGAKPTNIKIQAYFVDKQGKQSIQSDKCMRVISVANPTPTPAASITPKSPTTSGPLNPGAIAAIAGVILISIIIGLGVYFHKS